jgi:hypothetical protein
VATSVLNGTIGVSVENVLVVATLRPYGFVTVGGAALPVRKTDLTDSAGAYTFTLTQNDDIDPTNTYWEIEERLPAEYGGYRLWAVLIGSSSPVTVYDALIATPPS